MTAYKININTRNTPEQEIFISFQCNVLSVPTIKHNNISFKSQAIEFNGKKRTEIPIICLYQRISNKISKLQKENKIEVGKNLIENSDNKIVVSIIYLVYTSAKNFSLTASKLP